MSEYFPDPGELWIAFVKAPRIYADRAMPVKHRPVVALGELPGNRTLVMGLTTLPTFADGTPRHPVPAHDKIGLDRRGYIWGRPTAILTGDMAHLIGWASLELVDVIAEHGGLRDQDRWMLDKARENIRAAAGTEAA